MGETGCSLSDQSNLVPNIAQPAQYGGCHVRLLTSCVCYGRNPRHNRAAVSDNPFRLFGYIMSIHCLFDGLCNEKSLKVLSPSIISPSSATFIVPSLSGAPSASHHLPLRLALHLSYLCNPYILLSIRIFHGILTEPKHFDQG